tara:strand:- start:106 stop:981 length:876 start_codon:yes stop_codon:yes gene_type:complete
MGSKFYFSAEEILRWRLKQLSFGGSSADIDWLLDIGGGLGWNELQRLKVFRNGDYHLDIPLENLSLIWIKHLEKKIPLQYLLGKCPWSDFELEIDKSVLIPRQETEILLELALAKVSATKMGLWVDLGTGSGALAVGLARALTCWEGHAVDLSQAALEIASKNLKRLAPDSNVKVHLGNWSEPLDFYFGKFDLVVSNPPYIPTEILGNLDPIVRNNEPHIALSGGVDGMDSCRKVVEGSKKLLKSKGLLIFEHHYDQSERAGKLLLDYGFYDIDFHNDLNGFRRFAIGRNS